MDGGHETILDAEAVLQDLGDGSQAVGGAGGVGDIGHVGGVLFVVDAHDKHGSVVLGGSANDHVAGAGLDVALAQLRGQVLAGGLHDELGVRALPGDILGFHLAEDGDPAAVDDQGALLRVHGAGKLAVDGVIAQHIGHVIRGHEGIVDGHDLNILPLLRGAENQTADAAKAVNADSRFFHSERLLFVSIQRLFSNGSQFAWDTLG